MKLPGLSDWRTWRKHLGQTSPWRLISYAILGAILLSFLGFIPSDIGIYLMMLPGAFFTFTGIGILFVSPIRGVAALCIGLGIIGFMSNFLSPGAPSILTITRALGPPSVVAVDQAGEIYVLTNIRGLLYKFDRQGQLIDSVQLPGHSSNISFLMTGNGLIKLCGIRQKTWVNVEPDLTYVVTDERCEVPPLSNSMSLDPSVVRIQKQLAPPRVEIHRDDSSVIIESGWFYYLISTPVLMFGLILLGVGISGVWSFVLRVLGFEENERDD